MWGSIVSNVSIDDFPRWRSDCLHPASLFHHWHAHEHRSVKQAC